MHITKTTVTAKSRKLKAGWEIHDDTAIKQSLIIKVNDSSCVSDRNGNKYPYGITLENCHYNTWKEMLFWCNNNLKPGTFSITVADHDFWFREEKYRTLFLMTWS